MPVAIDRDPVVGVGQILGREPEVDRVAATSSRVQCGANIVSFGFSPFIAQPFDFPTIWMFPRGQGW